MISRFHITGSKTTDRPPSRRTIFADGAADDSFREDLDLELSHWVPNRTPERFKADTSTEICLRFAATPPEHLPDLVVNNHVDVDGLLSVFSLTHSELALAHDKLLIQAAEIGDFCACSPEASQRLYLALTAWMEDAAAEKLDKQAVYEGAFARLLRWLDSGVPKDAPRVQAGLEAMERSIERIESGLVMVAEATDRLTLFYYPALSPEDRARALYVPRFNSLLDERCWVWPQARNRFDGESIQLVSIPGENHGFHHDLWLPGYSWAETPDRWMVPGLVGEGTNGYRLDHPPLAKAVERLQAKETSRAGRWVLADKISPFSTLPGRGFPVVLSFVAPDGTPAESSLDSSQVADELLHSF